MKPPRAKRAVGVVAIVTAIVFNLGVSCTGFREDEIECEHAVIHLAECCPGFRQSAVDCSYSDQTNCSGDVVGSTYPALSLEDSRCLRQRSCAELLAGNCARAQNAKPRVTSTDGRSSSAAPRVCTR